MQESMSVPSLKLQRQHAVNRWNCKWFDKLMSMCKGNLALQKMTKNDRPGIIGKVTTESPSRFSSSSAADRVRPESYMPRRDASAWARKRRWCPPVLLANHWPRKFYPTQEERCQPLCCRTDAIAEPVVYSVSGEGDSLLPGSTPFGE
jgi:hypothetical protein